MRWIVYDLFCLVFAMRIVKQNKSGGTTFHVTREQVMWLMNNNVNPGDYFRAAVNVPAHERRALAIRMVNEQLDRDIIAKEERKAEDMAKVREYLSLQEEAEDAEAWHLAMAKARDAWDRVEVPADAPHAAAINAKLKAEFDAALAAEIGLNLPNV